MGYLSPNIAGRFIHPQIVDFTGGDYREFDQMYVLVENLKQRLENASKHLRFSIDDKGIFTNHTEGADILNECY
ncbi:MAG: hypothetical protein AAF998_11470 [Bacteroidota bacterium]